MALAHDSVSESHTGTTPSANQASFSWTHAPVGTPRSVLVYVFTFADAADVTSVTYGGVALTAVSGGEAICTDGDEDGRCRAYHLGASIPTGAQTVTVTRVNNADQMYATCHVATADADTEVYTPGIVLQQSVGTLAQQSPDDGSPGTNSIRYAAVTSGLDTVVSNGAASLGGTTASIDIGTRTAKTVYETTPGQGSRPVGFSSGTSDDRAAVYLAVREVASAPAAIGTPALPGLAAAGTAFLTQTASAAPTLPRLRAAGVTTHAQHATAVITLPRLAAAAAGTSTSTTAGAATLPALTSNGLAAVTVAALIAELTADIDITPALRAELEITAAVGGHPEWGH